MGDVEHEIRGGVDFFPAAGAFAAISPGWRIQSCLL
jgi:hypothetical protein